MEILIKLLIWLVIGKILIMFFQNLLFWKIGLSEYANHIKKNRKKIVSAEILIKFWIYSFLVYLVWPFFVLIYIALITLICVLHESADELRAKYIKEMEEVMIEVSKEEKALDE